VEQCCRRDSGETRLLLSRLASYRSPTVLACPEEKQYGERMRIELGTLSQADS